MKHPGFAGRRETAGCFPIESGSRAAAVQDFAAAKSSDHGLTGGQALAKTRLMSSETCAPFASDTELVAALESGDDSAAAVVEGWRAFLDISLKKKGATAADASA